MNISRELNFNVLDDKYLYNWKGGKVNIHERVCLSVCVFVLTN